MRLARLGVITLLLLVAAAPATGPATAPSDLEDLRQRALSEDLELSRVALRALLAKGASGKHCWRCLSAS